MARMKLFCGRRTTALFLALAGLALQSAASAAPPAPRVPRQDLPRRAAAQAGKPRALKSGLPAQESYARNLLRLMLQAEQRVALAGDQVTTLLRDGQPVTSEQRILRNGTHAFRMEYVQPPNLTGELIIDNGRTFWHYSPATKKVEVGPSRIDKLRGRVPQVMDQVRQGNLIVQYLGQDMIAGRNCGVIEVSSRDLTQEPRRRFWVDPANGAQLRIDQFGADGQTLSSSYYTSVSYNPTLAAGTFRPPATPAGARQVGRAAAGSAPLTIAQAQALAGFPVQQPTYLPPGFHFQAASVSDFRQKKLVALRYVNGLNVLSLFETSLGPRAAAQPAQITRPRPGVLNLFQNGLRFILVGNLSPSEMEKVIISVH